MKINTSNRIQHLGKNAFSIVEALVGSAVLGITFVAFYAGISSGFYMTESGRENLRATQLMVEKFEAVRLYTWDQVTNQGFIPSTFLGNYDFSTTNTNSGSIVYVGTMSVSNVPGTVSYSNDLRLITVSISWTQGNIPKSRTMTTLVTRRGLQQYVY